MDGPKELSQLFNNPLLSDIRIKQVSTSGEIREYFAHKVVLCMESQYFMNAFKGGFKEASDSVIELHDDDPYYFEIVLKSIYSPGYHTIVYDRTLDSPKEKVLAQIGTYIIANRYLVTRMCSDLPIDLAGYMNSDYVCPEALEAAVGAWYGSVAIIGDKMGHEIARAILGLWKSFDKPTFGKLVRQYPAFGSTFTLMMAMQGKMDTVLKDCMHCRPSWRERFIEKSA